jgi:hypothetical protein
MIFRGDVLDVKRDEKRRSAVTNVSVVESADPSFLERASSLILVVKVVPENVLDALMLVLCELYNICSGLAADFRPCHPGPCPPCQVALVVPCPSHHTPLTVKCAVASSNNAAMTPVCDEICERERECGNKDHACKVSLSYRCDMYITRVLTIAGAMSLWTLLAV